MSVVTGIMLITAQAEDKHIAEVQAWMGARHGGQQLLDCAHHAGGGKHPQYQAWAAGINRFDGAEEFASFVITRNWWFPENVVLILQPEEGPSRIFRPAGHEI